jgi:phosphatidylglycerophosphate synthase
MPQPDSDSTPSWILRWSLLNAVAVLGAVLIGRGDNSIRLVLALSVLSFLLYLWLARPRLKGRELWNWANLVSLFRWVVMAGLGLTMPQAPGALILGGGTLFMGLDTLDGWLARRQETQTEFSEYLDKEIDSLFLLTVCLGLVTRHVVGAWVLIIGLSRYAFVIALAALRPPLPKEKRSNRARLVYSAVLTVLLALFLPLPLPRAWPALGCLAGLLSSFFLDAREVFWGKGRG